MIDFKKYRFPLVANKSLTSQKIGLLDADLLFNGTKYPNLALMKLSGYLKENNFDVSLVQLNDDANIFDLVYISKIFSSTKMPSELVHGTNTILGGSGFYGERTPIFLPEIEFHKPDYTLYNDFIKEHLRNGVKKSRFKEYLDYSIGFTTRGCFRHCKFCINKIYNRVERHSKVEEFIDVHRPYLSLWDDNFLGYEKWHAVIDEIERFNKPFQYRQGLDIRLLTKEKARRLVYSNYYGDFIFAFDFIKDKALIENKLIMWRNITSRSTKFYILCAYRSQDVEDIITVFERIRILMKYKCLPYIMRFYKYIDSPWRGIYINIARWCNQPHLFKKMSFRDFCNAHKPNWKAYKYMVEFEQQYPEVAKKYFDDRFDNLRKY